MSNFLVWTRVLPIQCRKCGVSAFHLDVVREPTCSSAALARRGGVTADACPTGPINDVTEFLPVMDFKHAPALRAISTATPQHVVSQQDALEFARSAFGELDDFERLRSVFPNAGIDKRHIAMPADWYQSPRDWQQRTDAYLTVATDLFCQVSVSALERAGLRARDIDTVITVSSSGIATPTLDARAIERVGFKPRISRIPLFGLGCAGGAMGLSLAARLASGYGAGTVLLVVVELCSLASRSDRASASNIVATALFGDGAAAAVVAPARECDRVRLDRGLEHTWADTLGIMGWNVDPNGFEVVFDRAIPPFARRHLHPVINGFLSDLTLSSSDVSRFCFHPGGTRVLEAIEAAFSMHPGRLDIERQVLRDYGNMSAPTVLFVLDRFLRRPVPGTSLATALGPGFTTASVPIHVFQ
jgi:alkylresorcinol/alkylpyrone synthase